MSHLVSQSLQRYAVAVHAVLARCVTLYLLCVTLYAEGTLFCTCSLSKRAVGTLSPICAAACNLQLEAASFFLHLAFLWGCVSGNHATGAMTAIEPWMLLSLDHHSGIYYT